MYSALIAALTAINLQPYNNALPIWTTQNIEYNGVGQVAVSIHHAMALLCLNERKVSTGHLEHSFRL